MAVETAAADFTGGYAEDIGVAPLPHPNGLAERVGFMAGKGAALAWEGVKLAQNVAWSYGLDTDVVSRVAAPRVIVETVKD